jgi:dihydrofolate reductase
VFGRVTFEGMAAFWPTPAGAEAYPEVAKAMNAAPKFVVSRTLTEAGRAGTQVIRDHPEEALANLNRQAGKDGGADPTDLELLKTHQFASGNVLLYYEPVMG